MMEENMTKKDWRNFALCAVLATIAALSICYGVISCEESMTYKRHDVTIRAYHLDGGTKIMHFECIPTWHPRIDARGTKPWLEVGDRYIPYIDRFDILDSKPYTLTGKELNERQKNK